MCRHRDEPARDMADSLDTWYKVLGGKGGWDVIVLNHAMYEESPDTLQHAQRNCYSSSMIQNSQFMSSECSG